MSGQEKHRPRPAGSPSGPATARHWRSSFMAAAPFQPETLSACLGAAVPFPLDLTRVDSVLMERAQCSLTHAPHPPREHRRPLGRGLRAE